MGEVVLGIGTSHSPMLNAAAEEWARFAPRDPTLQLFDRDGEPTAYDALLAQVLTYSHQRKASSTFFPAIRFLAMSLNKWMYLYFFVQHPHSKPCPYKVAYFYLFVLINQAISISSHYPCHRICKFY